MAHFIWKGSTGHHGSSANNMVINNTGVTYTPDTDYWVTEANSWNNTANWFKRVAGASGGQTGGETYGPPGSYYYEQATTVPSGNDTAQFTKLSIYPPDGLTQDYPLSECLYGGVAEGAGNGFSGGAAGTTGGNVSIQIDNNYWSSDTVDPRPQHYNRFGICTNCDIPFKGDVTSYAGGLNLFVADFLCFTNAASDGVQPSQSPNSQMLICTDIGPNFKLMGSATKIKEFNQVGRGRFHFKGNYIEQCTLFPNPSGGGFISRRDYEHGPIGGMYNFDGIHVSQYLGVFGERLDKLTYRKHSPSAGQNAIPIVHIGTRYYAYPDQVVHGPRVVGGVGVNYNDTTNGTVELETEVDELNIYPWEPIRRQGGDADDLTGFIPPIMGYTGTPAVMIRNSWDSEAHGYTYGTVKLHKTNPFASVVFDTFEDESEGDNVLLAGGEEYPDGEIISNKFFNLRLGVDSAEGCVNDVNTLTIEAGSFETRDLNSELRILDGTIEEQGVVDLRNRAANGKVQIAGYSGGVGADDAGTYGGLFLNSSGAKIYPPQGVNVAILLPDGGSTAGDQGTISPSAIGSSGKRG